MRMNMPSMWRNSNRLGKYDAHFLVKIADLLEVGFTLQQSLVFLLEQYDVLTEKDRLVYLSMVQEGASLSSILKVMGFGNAIVIQVSFAEIHGEVLTNLRESASYLDNVRQTTSKLIKSLQYPLLLVAIFITILITLNFTVIPQFKSLYTAMGTESKGIVSVLIAMLESLPYVLGASLMLVVISAVGMFCIFNMKHIEQKCSVLSRIPIFGFFFRGYQTYRFSREFGYFLNNGLEVKEILDLFIHQEINPYLRLVSQKIEVSLMNGDSLSGALAQMDMIDEKLSVFVSHGEQNSSVGKELIMFSEYTLERLIMRLENMTRRIQPVIFLILGILIVCLYLIIVLPIFQMMSEI
ncbi:competence type IV pilus assembly protein ComGB [Salinicoccus sp. ID82-1]|uniref:competence type IV pilus assembly protein ComGB n=1 Tax=Salinicoccus sp. ID82-1 TaxID=2820269 RepID=UPI001F22874D|nr:competence type IV pilus assembly protein ComGB [Salinicoccus sp. ID82-1]